MPGYEVKHERVPVPGEAHLRIRSLRNHQQFADPAGAAAALGISSAQWPLFGLLWPSGRVLAAHMAQRLAVPGERILEIGCGLALASLVCHRQGADITASDCHPLAGAFLLENLRLNHLPPLPYRHGQWGAQSGVPSAAALLLVPLQGRFDLVIGSDVLYERDDGGTLVAFLHHHAQPAAEVLIVDPDRGNRSGFTRRMAALGFTLAQTRVSATAVGEPAYKGRLLHYRRPAQACTPTCATT